jgi:hypothetical protein
MDIGKYRSNIILTISENTFFMFLEMESKQGLNFKFCNAHTLFSAFLAQFSVISFSALAKKSVVVC